ncbi:MAG TPA: hypothetical protein VMW17_15745 [Candidatus Binatia bacterium]|nr:hypothetical protein [Candidatus Binatia bacterium]
MKSTPRWLAVLAVGGGLIACHRGQTAPGVTFFPLHAEDTWIYEVARPLRNERTRMTVRARGDQFIEVLHRNAYLVEESYAADDENGGHPETYPIAYYRENGFLYRAMSLEYHDGKLRDAGLGSAEERFLPDVFGADTRWESLTTAYDLGPTDHYGVTQHHRAAVDPSVISVPAGQFSGCVRVDTVAVHHSHREGHADDAPVTLYYADWYAPNVGLVRTIQSSRADGGPPLAEIALVAYDVEGARH